MRVEMILNGDFHEIKNKIVETFPNLMRLSFDGEEQDKWVSVEDRLPSHAVSVLVCSEDGIVEEGFYDEVLHCFISESDFEQYENGEITHWMPLPEPPKGE